MSLTEKEARKRIEKFEKYIGHHEVPYVRNDQEIARIISLLNELVPKPKPKEEPKKDDKKKKDKPK